ncbi:MAG: hypothetical protein VX642_03410 [Bdellovibrionota bacterium]|nr:hypothetical protein [Bdellovibrionota bacterium]
MWKNRFYKFTVVQIITTLFAGLSFAVAELDTREKIVLEGTSKQSSAFKAKADIQRQLIGELGSQLVMDLMGEEAYAKKRREIDRVIQRNFAKFIPYVNPGDLKRDRNGSYRQEIEFEVSRISLRDILSMEGLLYEQLKQVRVLPVIGYLDVREAKSYKWWMGDSEKSSEKLFLFNLSRNFEKKLSKSIWSEGFYYFQPEDYRSFLFLPSDLKAEAHRKKDLIQMGKDLNVELVISGNIRVANSDIHSEISSVHVELKAILVESEREIALTEETWNTKIGDYKKEVLISSAENFENLIKDFSAQIEAAYEKGKFGTRTYPLILMGDLSYPQFEALKRKIQITSYQIKNLKERRMTAGKFELEMDVTGDLEKLKKSLSRLKLDGLNFGIESEGNGIQLNISGN